MVTRLLTYAECAKELGMSVVSIKRFVGKGILPVVRFSSHMVRIPADKLEALIAAGGCPKGELTAG